MNAGIDILLTAHGVNEHKSCPVKPKENSLGRRYTSFSSLSTVMVHSPTSAARAPIAANTGAKTAPTTPIVSGKVISSLPFLSLMVILRMLPSAINSFTFFRRCSPLIEKDSLVVFVICHYFLQCYCRAFTLQAGSHH